MIPCLNPVPPCPVTCFDNFFDKGDQDTLIHIISYCGLSSLSKLMVLRRNTGELVISLLNNHQIAQINGFNLLMQRITDTYRSNLKEPDALKCFDIQRDGVLSAIPARKISTS